MIASHHAVRLPAAKVFLNFALEHGRIRLGSLMFSQSMMDGEGMASTQRVELYPAADAEFQQFLRWRAECHARSERLEQIDDGMIPSQFVQHVSHYRYARACAVMDREADPETMGIEAVREWLHVARAQID